MMLFGWWVLVILFICCLSWSCLAFDQNEATFIYFFILHLRFIGSLFVPSFALTKLYRFGRSFCLSHKECVLLGFCSFDYNFCAGFCGVLISDSISLQCTWTMMACAFLNLLCFGCLRKLSLTFYPCWTLLILSFVLTAPDDFLVYCA